MYFLPCQCKKFKAIFPHLVEGREEQPGEREGVYGGGVHRTRSMGMWKK